MDQTEKCEQKFQPVSIKQRKRTEVKSEKKQTSAVRCYLRILQSIKTQLTICRPTTKQQWTFVAVNKSKQTIHRKKPHS